MVALGTGRPQGQLWLNLTSAREGGFTARAFSFQVKEAQKGSETPALLPAWALQAVGAEHLQGWQQSPSSAAEPSVPPDPRIKAGHLEPGRALNHLDASTLC